MQFYKQFDGCRNLQVHGRSVHRAIGRAAFATETPKSDVQAFFGVPTDPPTHRLTDRPADRLYVFLMFFLSMSADRQIELYGAAGVMRRRTDMSADRQRARSQPHHDPRGVREQRQVVIEGHGCAPCPMFAMFFGGKIIVYFKKYRLKKCCTNVLE